MITEFINSWELFARPYLLTVLAGAVLAMVGVITMARRQVFMAAAVAQASTFGYAVFGFLVGGAGTESGEDLVRDAVVVGSAVVAALLTMLGRTDRARSGRLDGDERTAWVFIAASAGAILILARSPMGMEQLRRIQGSSLIGATTLDVAIFAAVLLVTVVLLAIFSRPLVLLLADPVMASAIGMRVALWNILLAMGVGLCVGLTVRSTGMLFAFGCLALPVMIAKQLCGEVRSLFVASPLLAAILSLTGLWLAYTWDLPPGQVVVGLSCITLALAVIARTIWGWLGS